MIPEALQLSMYPSLELLHRRSLTRFTLKTKDSKHILTNDMLEPEEVEDVLFSIDNPEAVVLKIRGEDGIEYAEFVLMRKPGPNNE